MVIKNWIQNLLVVFCFTLGAKAFAYDPPPKPIPGAKMCREAIDCVGTIPARQPKKCTAVPSQPPGPKPTLECKDENSTDTCTCISFADAGRSCGISSQNNCGWQPMPPNGMGWVCKGDFDSIPCNIPEL